MTTYENPIEAVSDALQPELDSAGIPLMDTLRSGHRDYPFVTLAYGGHTITAQGFVSRVLVLVHAANSDAPGAQKALGAATVTVREIVRADATLLYIRTGPSVSAMGHLTAVIDCQYPESR